MRLKRSREFIIINSLPIFHRRRCIFWGSFTCTVGRRWVNQWSCGIDKCICTIHKCVGSITWERCAIIGNSWNWTRQTLGSVPPIATGLPRHVFSHWQEKVVKTPGNDDVVVNTYQKGNHHACKSNTYRIIEIAQKQKFQLTTRRILYKTYESAGFSRASVLKKISFLCFIK